MMMMAGRISFLSWFYPRMSVRYIKLGTKSWGKQSLNPEKLYNFIHFLKIDLTLEQYAVLLLKSDYGF